MIKKTDDTEKISDVEVKISNRFAIQENIEEITEHNEINHNNFCKGIHYNVQISAKESVGCHRMYHGAMNKELSLLI
jgi:hypothetical protein